MDYAWCVLTGVIGSLTENRRKNVKFADSDNSYFTEMSIFSLHKYLRLRN